jgi:hypothetical protein
MVGLLLHSRFEDDALVLVAVDPDDEWFLEAEMARECLLLDSFLPI